VHGVVPALLQISGSYCSCFILASTNMKDEFFLLNCVIGVEWTGLHLFEYCLN